MGSDCADDRDAQCQDGRVTDRLSALDVSFLYLESPTTAMHVGGVAVFAPPVSDEPFDYDKHKV